MAKGHKKNKAIYKLLYLMQLLSSVFFGYQLCTLKMLPALYEGIIIAVLAAFAILNYFLFFRKKKQGSRLVAILLVLLISLGSLWGGKTIYETKNTLQSISGAKEEITQLAIYVNQDDPVTSVGEMTGYGFGYVEESDVESVQKLFEQVKELTGEDVQKTGYSSVVSMVDAMMDGEIKAIISNDHYLEMVKELSSIETEGTEASENTRDYATFIQNLCKVEEFTYKVKVEEEQVDVNKDSFIVYISGIDTTGAVSTKSRSDVNILAAINTKTREIQLVTTPRDYYVPLSISNGQKDKLTHAGIYGIQCSEDTLAELYGVQIDYYFRVNFTGFQQIVDAIGGITVDSDYDFSVDGYSYHKGANDLNGAEALRFARERHSFGDGDNQRGRNQMKVIEGIVRKCCSPAILANYTDVLNAVQGCFETNMDYDRIAKLVQNQIADNIAWKIDSYSATGEGTSATTYSMPGRMLYVAIPDMDSVNEGTRLLQETLERQ